MDETKITARLPQLDVEITRREVPEDNAETITLRMTAVPSFGAFADHFVKLGGFPLMSLGAVSMMNPWMSLSANPLLYGMQLAQAAWTPVLEQLTPRASPGRDDKGDT